MDEGFFQLLFFLVIVAVALLEGVIRSARRRRAEEAEAEAPEEPGRELEPQRQPRGEEPSRRLEPTSSEGLIPGEIWEEIAGLAREGARTPVPAPPAPRDVDRTPRQETGARTRPAPWTREAPRERPRPPQPARAPAPAGRPEPSRPRERRALPVPEPEAPDAAELERAALREHLRAGRRGQQLEPSAPVEVEGAGTPAAARLGLTGRQELRRAVLHREVLGPPVSLREPGEGPLGG